MSQMSMYPNPATEVLTVKTNHLQHAQIQIINQQGSTIDVPFTETTSGIYRLEIKDLPQGIYKLKVQSSQGFSIGTFVKE